MKQTIYLSGNDLDILESAIKNLPIIAVEKGFLNGTIAFPALDDLIQKRTNAVTAIKIDFNTDVVSLDEILQVYAKLVDFDSPNEEENLKEKIYKKVISYPDLLIGIEAKAFIEENIGNSKNIEFTKMLNFFKYKK